MSRFNPAPYYNNVLSDPDTDLLPTLSAELYQRLKDLLDQALLGFIRPNSMSQSAQHASELANFREVMAHRNSNDDVDFLRSFREFVPTTNHESYRPFIAKFFATPCKESDHDMWKCTKHGVFGTFPDVVLAFSCLITIFFGFGQALKMDFEDGHSSKVLPVCSVTVGFLRMQMNWHVEHDKDRIDLWVPGKTDPYAISLVKSYCAFFILNALFALADRRVTTIRFLFASVFANFLQYVEDEWPLLVDCIEKGTIPGMENLDHLREPLEVIFANILLQTLFVLPNFAKLGPPAVRSWAVRVWPDLKQFIGITGGPAAASVPKVTHCILGPSVPMQAPFYGSSECYIAILYFNGDPNTDFKAVDGVTEYLDVRWNEPLERVLSAARTWELVTGGHYEPVLTTRDGLWRYRIGDVTVKGFAPDDGLPVINYRHRRDGSLGLAYGSTCTESQLTNAIISASQRWIGQIIDFTIVADDRDTPVTYGYLIKIGGDIGKDAKIATRQTFEDLMTNDEYHMAFWQGRARKSTICIVERGTFTEYRRQKCDKANVSRG
ncbi:hypothetical protein BDR05DRAFT_1061199 [Suillus weaverae]|nr:hypothetical protein BDR05DRAFT_1061199 [Suillus weaverae]